MKIIITSLQYHWKDRVVETYAHSVTRAFQERGHEVIEVGPGHAITTLDEAGVELVDHVLELDCGRDPQGNFHFLIPPYKDQLPKGQRGSNGPLPPNSIYFIDSHGQPSLHHRLAPQYTYVFYAVWARRDLFEHLVYSVAYLVVR